MSEFSGVADDFMVGMNLNTTLALPNSRDTILHFCEAVQREFPSMTSFYQRESGEFVLEGDRDSGNYQWMELHPHRLSAGFYNPPALSAGYGMHTWLLDRSVYFLGVSAIDVDSLDATLAFDLDYKGNRDDIVAQALLSGSPLGALMGERMLKTLEFEPNMVVALDEGCYLQARVQIETRGATAQVRTGEYEDEPISVYLTIRRYQRPGRTMAVRESFAQQCEWCEDLARRAVVPNIINPIAAAIAGAD
jgi:hypothetical protein